MRTDVTLEEKTRAIHDGVRAALREHALLGRPISVWRDGKVVILSPAETLEELHRTASDLEVPTTPKSDAA